MGEAKVKINVQTGDLEFEGSEQFVKEQMGNLEDTIDIIAQLLIENEDGDENEIETLEEPKDLERKKETLDINPDRLEVPSVFGEWYHNFNNNLNEQDLALLTGYYIQKSSEKNEFKTKEINDTLKELGI